MKNTFGYSNETAHFFLSLFRSYFSADLACMMKAVVFLAFLLGSYEIYGQQERQYSQFMYNKLALNPAFAGAQPSTTFTFLYRNQWLGFDGSPVTQTLSANVPLPNQNIGIGANLIHSSIGISDMWTLSGMYAYKIELGQGSISGGVEASIRYYGINYRDERLHADQDLSIDRAIIDDNLNKLVPNVGLGLYYSDRSFYVGISAPRVLRSKIDFKDALLISREQLHMYLMAGYSVGLAENIFLTPQVNIKFAKNSPIGADLNLMFDYDTKFNAGISYRTGGIANPIGESIDILAGLKIVQNLTLGLAYDIPIGALGGYTNGSIELMLRYALPADYDTDVQNPRFF